MGSWQYVVRFELFAKSTPPDRRFCNTSRVHSVTNEASIRIVMFRMILDAAKEQYGVSDRMLQHRLNVSGVRVQRQRGRY